MGAWFRWIKKLYQNLNEKLEGVKAGIQGVGNTYFVNGNTGLNTNDGLTPDRPLLTIAAALVKCTNGHDDYIRVLNHYQETFPITVNKSMVHIIAHNVGQPMVWLTASGDTAIFNIEADFVEIAGFEFRAGASHAAIEFTAQKGYGRIHHCAFGWMQTGQDGIKVLDTFDSPETIIEKCLFGNGLTRDGIHISHDSLAAAMTRGLIQDNIFRSVTGVAINAVGQITLGIIRRNKFMLPSNTAGKAITLCANCSGTFVEDNDANHGDQAAMAAIPWVVTGGASGNNCFDNNKRGGVVVFPG